MPILKSDKLGLMIDTGGCPNRCAHCRLSGKPTRQMPHQEMRWIVEQFRELQKNNSPLFSGIDVGLWCMEPDYRDDYRSLWDLEDELGDANREHGGLLSIWRILRDDTYLTWVKEKGARLCQITLFGAGATHDRFMGRRDAFKECIEVMKRLVEASIAVQWSLIFTKAIVPDLEKLLRLAEELHLPGEYARLLGYNWRAALTDVGPMGRGWHLEHLRPSLSDLDHLQGVLPRSDWIDWWVKDTEAECTRIFLDGKLQRKDVPEILWLHVDSSFNFETTTSGSPVP